MVDTAVYDEFVTASSPRLLRTAYLLTRDWAAAEDLLQTALMKAWLRGVAWTENRRRTCAGSSRRRTCRGAVAGGGRRSATASCLSRPAPIATAAVDERSSLWSAWVGCRRANRAVLVLRLL